MGNSFCEKMIRRLQIYVTRPAGEKSEHVFAKNMPQTTPEPRIFTATISTRTFSFITKPKLTGLSNIPCKIITLAFIKQFTHLTVKPEQTLARKIISRNGDRPSTL